MTGPDSLDKVIEAMPTAGPSRKARKEVTYEDFQKVLDSTPLFMRESPKDGEDNDVLGALRSLVFEGEGDGKLLLLISPVFRLTVWFRGLSEFQESRE